MLNPLAAGVDWSDGSQQAATARVADVHRRAAQIPAVLHAAVPIVQTWAGELASAQATLSRLESLAALHGLTITADGRVEPAEGVLASALEKLTDPTDHVAETLQAKVRAILAEATAADESCARRLLALLPDDGPWQAAATATLAPLAGTSLRGPANRPLVPGAGGAGPARGASGSGPGPSGGGLGRFFRRLVNPNGPWPAPRPGTPWTGSGKTTQQLKASGREQYSPKSRLTRAGHVLTKHNPGTRSGHEMFPKPRGDVRKKNQIAEEVIDSILDNPRTLEVPATRGQCSGGSYYITPDGRGLAYDANGVLRYWSPMQYPGRRQP